MALKTSLQLTLNMFVIITRLAPIQLLALYLCQVQVISVFADRYLPCKTVNWARTDVAEGQQRVW